MNIQIKSGPPVVLVELSIDQAIIVAAAVGSTSGQAGMRVYKDLTAAVSAYGYRWDIQNCYDKDGALDCDKLLETVAYKGKDSA